MDLNLYPRQWTLTINGISVPDTTALHLAKLYGIFSLSDSRAHFLNFPLITTERLHRSKRTHFCLRYATLKIELNHKIRSCNEMHYRQVAFNIVSSETRSGPKCDPSGIPFHHHTELQNSYRDRGKQYIFQFECGR